MEQREPKILDTGEYVAVLRALVEEGREVSMVVWGGSMTPFLGHGRDRIFFAAPQQPLRRGDMVFFRRAGGQNVMHRICRVRPEGFYLVGDAQVRVEGPIRREQIFARVTRVERKGRLLAPGDPLWDFFAGPWLLLRPLRPAILRLYRALRRK